MLIVRGPNKAITYRAVAESIGRCQVPARILAMGQGKCNCKVKTDIVVADKEQLEDSRFELMPWGVAPTRQARYLGPSLASNDLPDEDLKSYDTAFSKVDVEIREGRRGLRSWLTRCIDWNSYCLSCSSHLFAAGKPAPSVMSKIVRQQRQVFGRSNWLSLEGLNAIKTLLGSSNAPTHPAARAKGDLLAAELRTWGIPYVVANFTNPGSPSNPLSGKEGGRLLTLVVNSLDTVERKRPDWLGSTVDNYKNKLSRLLDNIKAGDASAIRPISQIAVWIWQALETFSDLGGWDWYVRRARQRRLFPSEGDELGRLRQLGSTSEPLMTYAILEFWLNGRNDHRRSRFQLGLPEVPAKTCALCQALSTHFPNFAFFPGTCHNVRNEEPAFAPFGIYSLHGACHHGVSFMQHIKLPCALLFSRAPIRGIGIQARRAPLRNEFEEWITAGQATNSFPDFTICRLCGEGEDSVEHLQC